MSDQERGTPARPIPRGVVGKAYQAHVTRTAAKFQTFFAVLWTGLAVMRWLVEGAGWLTWAWTALAVGIVAAAALHWRSLWRDPAPGGD